MQAVRRNYRQSPRKVRLVADEVRGMPAKRALVVLNALNKRAAQEVAKVLQSAIANAKHNDSIAEENLFIKEIQVNEGIVLKRFIPRAFGRATPINKRTSHLTIILGKRETETETTEKRNAEDAPLQSEAQTAAS